jgi:hypothetical protein
MEFFDERLLSRASMIILSVSEVFDLCSSPLLANEIAAIEMSSELIALSILNPLTYHSHIMSRLVAAAVHERKFLRLCRTCL